jgi:hypothetical protein
MSLHWRLGIAGMQHMQHARSLGSVCRMHVVLLLLGAKLLMSA